MGIFSFFENETSKIMFWLVFKWCSALLPDRHQVLHISSFVGGLPESIVRSLVDKVASCGMLSSNSGFPASHCFPVLHSSHLENRMMK